MKPGVKILESKKGGGLRIKLGGVLMSDPDLTLRVFNAADTSVPLLELTEPPKKPTVHLSLPNGTRVLVAAIGMHIATHVSSHDIELITPIAIELEAKQEKNFGVHQSRPAHNPNEGARPKISPIRSAIRRGLNGFKRHKD